VAGASRPYHYWAASRLSKFRSLIFSVALAVAPVVVALGANVDDRSPIFNNGAGVVVGAPTGGANGQMGPGTINLQGSQAGSIFVNGQPASGGTVTSVAGGTANGATVTITNPSTTPTVVVSPAVTGLLKSANGAFAPAVSSDITGVLGFTPLSPTGSGAALTGLTFGQLGGFVLPSQIPTPTTSALGGVQATTSTAHEFLTGISTSGVPSLAQPAFTDISGNPSSAQVTGGLGFTPVNPAAAAITGGSITGTSFTGTVTGHSTLDLPLTGGTLTGTLGTAGINDSVGVNTPCIGCTTPGVVNGTTVNATGANGYQQFGATLIRQIFNVQGSLTAGQGSDNCLLGALDTCIGSGAGAAVTASVSEASLGGTLTGNQLTSGSFPTIWGQHGLGYATTANSTTGEGDDVFRNVVTNNSGTAVGKDAHRDWFADNNAFFGAFAGSGNAASVTVSGTLTAGDVIPLIFTGPLIVGTPFTMSVTVPATPTTASIAAAICSAFTALQSTVFTDNYGCNTDSTDSPGVASISHNGTSTQGGSHVVTVTLGSFSGTETITIGNGATGTQNVGMGLRFMHGLAATTANSNVGGGTNVFINATSLSKETCFGDASCISMTSDHNGNVVGAGSATNLNGSFRIGIFATGCTSPAGALSDVYIFGDCTLNNGWFTTGNGVLIGNNPETASQTGTGQLSLMNFMFAQGMNGSGSTASSGCVSFFAKSDCTNGALQIGGPLLLDNFVRVGPVALTIPTGAVGIAKESASGSAPGTSGGIVQLVCGTNSGSAKLIALAGTSTTPVTILDNIGSGVNGC
jgi:hypothetical protein